MNKYKRLGFYVILIFTSFITGIVILEIAVRMLAIAPRVDNQYSGFVSDDILTYRPKPNSTISGRSASDEFTYQYRHNSYGFRDIEYDTINRNDKKFIILGLGDSFTYGVGAKFEETYLYLLEQKLNSRKQNDPIIQIIKAGIPRYFPEMQRILFEKFAPVFKPDLVIVGFLPNDIIDTYYGIDNFIVEWKSGYLITKEAQKFGSIGLYLYRNSHLFRIIIQFYIQALKSDNVIVKTDEIYIDNGYYEKEWQAIEKEYKKIIQIADGLGAKTLIVHIPQRINWNERHFYISSRFEKFVSRNGAHFVDTLPGIISASKNKTLYYKKDGHCTPEGYKIIAYTIYDYLILNKLVP